ncbi:MAG: hypothetical protein AAF978_10470 [Cyanobacteria bacterium P01_E01_bin.48]
MVTRLSDSELQHAEELLGDYAPARAATILLKQHDGNLETSLEELVVVEAGAAAYGEERKKLREVFLRNLRREICGDDSFLTKVEEFNKSPTKATLLTGLIVYAVDLVTIPINPAIATIAVLWMLKLGVRTFCDYTEPEES